MSKLTHALTPLSKAPHLEILCWQRGRVSTPAPYFASREKLGPTVGISSLRRYCSMHYPHREVNGIWLVALKSLLISIASSGWNAFSEDVCEMQAALQSEWYTETLSIPLKFQLHRTLSHLYPHAQPHGLVGSQKWGCGWSRCSATQPIPFLSYPGFIKAEVKIQLPEDHRPALLSICINVLAYA